MKKRWMVAGIFIVLAGAGLLIYLRQPRYAQPVGQLQVMNNQILMDRAASFVSANQSKVCSGQLHAYDDKYLYTTVYCADFIGQHTAAARADNSFIGPARFEYRKGSTILGVSLADGSKGAASEVALFPKAAVDAANDFSQQSGRSQLAAQALKKAKR